MRTVLLKVWNNFFNNTVRYSRVPTDDNELREIHDVINCRLSTSTHITVTPDIKKQCMHKINSCKDDGDLGLNLITL